MSRLISPAVARWPRRAAVAGLGVALLLPLGAWLAVTGWARDVLLIAPHDPSVVDLNRSLWSAGEPVAEIYGSPMSESTRVLLWSERRILRPQEDPALALLPVAGPGTRPIQVRTVWWAVRVAELLAGATAVTLFAAAAVAGRRARTVPAECGA